MHSREQICKVYVHMLERYSTLEWVISQISSSIHLIVSTTWVMILIPTAPHQLAQVLEGCVKGTQAHKLIKGFKSRVRSHEKLG